MTRMLAPSLVAMVASACSPDVCRPYVLPAGTDLTTPTVTFRGDVMPVLSSSCASCHADPQFAPIGELGVDAERSYTNLLAPKLPSYAMPYVAPGDPSGSMIVHMLDWDSSCTSACETAYCGDDMPYGGSRLSDDDRMKVRRWIAQGAKDD